jgi:hypothetical protein
MRTVTTIILSLFSFAAFAQVDTTLVANPVVDGNVNVNLLIGAEEALFSALLLVITYFSYMIPGLKKLQNKHIRALAIGCTLILGFVTYHAASGENFNIAQLINYAISYILTTSAYDKIFKPVGLRTVREANKD